jgi:hypothetical protein
VAGVTRRCGPGRGGGIQVGNRFSAVPLSGTTTIDNNTLVRTGTLDPNWKFGVGAIWFYASDSENMTGTINVDHNTITNPGPDPAPSPASTRPTGSMRPTTARRRRRRGQLHGYGHHHAHRRSAISGPPGVRRQPYE